MKKLFKISSVILAVAMLCMLFIVPASAAATGAGISLGLDATALPGETVTIPVRAENMQGVAALEFTVDLGGLTDAQVVAGTWDAATVAANTAVNADGDVKVACYGESLTGTLFSIVAKVPAADCTVTVDGASVLAFDLNENEIAVAGDSVKVTAYAVKYDGMSLVMGETVDLKLYFTDNSDAYTPELTVTYKEDADSEIKTVNVDVNEAGEYFVKIPRYSFQMADEVLVTASYVVNEQNFTIVEDKAVMIQNYFDAQKDKADLAQATVDALYAMAKYGEVAATYFTTAQDVYTAPSYTNVNIGYQGGAITSSADVDLSALTKPEVDTTAIEVAVDENDAIVDAEYNVNLSDLRETLVLSSEVCFKLYTEITAEESATYTYSYGTDLKDLQSIGSDLMGSYGDDYVTIKVPVKAYQLGQTFYVKATNALDETVAIVKYIAPDSYIARTWEYTETNEGLRTMLSALEVYGNSASAYYTAQVNA